MGLRDRLGRRTGSSAAAIKNTVFLLWWRRGAVAGGAGQVRRCGGSRVVCGMVFRGRQPRAWA
jgi:hypothetical protein